jgi:hypothetical protein
MLEWKETHRKSSSGQWVAKLGNAEIIVHYYVGMGMEIFLTCTYLEVYQVGLGTEDMEEAKRKAIEYVNEHLQEKIKEYTDMYNNCYGME